MRTGKIQRMTGKAERRVTTREAGRVHSSAWWSFLPSISVDCAGPAAPGGSPERLGGTP